MVSLAASICSATNTKKRVQYKSGQAILEKANDGAWDTHQHNEFQATDQEWEGLDRAAKNQD